MKSLTRKNIGRQQRRRARSGPEWGQLNPSALDCECSLLHHTHTCWGSEGKAEVVVLVNQAEQDCQNESFHPSNAQIIWLSQSDIDILGKSRVKTMEEFPLQRMKNRTNYNLYTVVFIIMYHYFSCNSYTQRQRLKMVHLVVCLF